MAVDIYNNVFELRNRPLGGGLYLNNNTIAVIIFEIVHDEFSVV